MTGNAAPLKRVFAPSHLRPELDHSRVTATVVVQTWSSLDETKEFLALAAAEDFIAGVVGWVDLTQVNVASVLQELQNGPNGKYLVGIRHQVHDEDDANWLMRPDVQRGLTAVQNAGLAYDLLIRPRELPAALKTVAMFPELRFVVNHIAKPDIKNQHTEPWATLMEAFREHRGHVWCKLSALATEADHKTWVTNDLAPYVNRVLDIFGPDRCLYGSDWPVCTLAGSYSRVLMAVEDIIAGLSAQDRQQIMSGSAMEVYRLETEAIKSMQSKKGVMSRIGDATLNGRELSVGGNKRHPVQLGETKMNIPRLGVSHLGGLPHAVKRPTYDRSQLQQGIVHLGIGAFMRCHMAVATEAVLDSGDLRWGIVGVSLRQSDTRDALDPQDCLYTVAIRSHVQGQTHQNLQVIGAVTEVLLATQQSQRVLDCLSGQETRIVSLTVTEKGYCHDPATGTLQLNHPDIVYDIAHPLTPRSAIGFIVRGLAVRRALGRRPVTLMSLDNLPSNGRILSNVVLGLAKLIDPKLRDWIAENCSFPCSMVDRIVPRTTADDRASISYELGCEDVWPVIGEPFFDWAVEDNFVADRPDWTLGGSRFVADAEPWERLKLRMVNGAHSSIAYLSVMAGWETVGVAMRQAPLLEHINALMRDEIEPTLPPLSGLNLTTNRTQLLTRYANPALHHRTHQIAADGSQKLPQRLLDTIRDRLSAGLPVPRLALSVASWLYHLQGVDESGKIFVIDDPLVEPLTQLYQAALADDLSDDSIQKLLAFSPVFGDGMMPLGFVDAVGVALKSLHTAGVLSTLHAVNRGATL